MAFESELEWDFLCFNDLQAWIIAIENICFTTLLTFWNNKLNMQQFLNDYKSFKHKLNIP